MPHPFPRDFRDVWGSTFGRWGTGIRPLPDTGGDPFTAARLGLDLLKGLYASGAKDLRLSIEGPKKHLERGDASVNYCDFFEPDGASTYSFWKEDGAIVNTSRPTPPTKTKLGPSEAIKLVLERHPFITAVTLNTESREQGELDGQYSVIYIFSTTQQYAGAANAGKHFGLYEAPRPNHRAVVQNVKMRKQLDGVVRALPGVGLNYWNAKKRWNGNYINQGNP